MAFAPCNWDMFSFIEELPRKTIYTKTRNGRNVFRMMWSLLF